MSETKKPAAQRKAPREPQDHQPKQDQIPPPDRIQTITWEGNDYSIDPARLDDIVFFEYLSEMETKPFFIAKVTAHMLGPEQWEQFKVNAADEHGRVPADRVAEFFNAAQDTFHLGN